MRTFCIDDWQSEPYCGNQNFAELGWRDTKHKIQMLLDTSGAPAELWLEAGQYICTMMNHMAYKSLGWRTPHEWLCGLFHVVKNRQGKVNDKIDNIDKLIPFHIHYNQSNPINLLSSTIATTGSLGPASNGDRKPIFSC